MSYPRMCEGKIHSLGHGSSMDDSIVIDMTSEMAHEHISNACTGIWEEYDVVDIRCDYLIYETREVITPITPSQEDGINSVDCSDCGDRALGCSRDRIIVEGDIMLGGYPLESMWESDECLHARLYRCCLYAHIESYSDRSTYII